jgi:MFS family permease
MSLNGNLEAEESPATTEAGQTKPIRLSPSGSPLYPAVTEDPLDPLNWNFVQKYTCIVIACFAYCLLTYFTTAPVPSFTELEVQFDTTYTKVNWSFAVPCLGLAIGPLITSSLAETYGRRIVLIASTAVAVVASGCTSLHGNSLSGYMAARFFQGLGAGPSANIGLTVINDLSFEHERGFRVGLWAMSANVGTVLGAVGMYKNSDHRTILTVSQWVASWLLFLSIGLATMLLFSSGSCLSANVSSSQKPTIHEQWCWNMKRGWKDGPRPRN